MKIKIGIIFGGPSVEHEISIITALQAIANLNKEKYEIIPLYIDKKRNWYTGDCLFKIENYQDLEKLIKKAIPINLIKKDNSFVIQKQKGRIKKELNTIDIAFPIVHGKGVEDGTLAGYLETLGICYVGPDVLGASIGQDKVIQKQILQNENLPVPKFIWFYESEYKKDTTNIYKKINNLTYPVIVKPAKLGSSIGIGFVHKEEQLEDAILDALQYDEKIIVEEVIENTMEVDCAVIGDAEEVKTSVIGEMYSSHELLTFEDKYLSKTKGKEAKDKYSSGFKIPANLEKDIEKEIYTLAKKAFRVLNLKGVTRFDFLIDKESKKIYINEPNTIPGSLAYFFFTPKNISYSMLLDELITLAIKEYKKKKKKIISFSSNVLKTYCGNKRIK